MASKISTTIAQNTAKEISKEVISLEASSMISLFEIDLSQIKINLNLGSTDIAPDVLRFHGHEAIGQRKIYFRGDTYHPMAIQTDGFETTSTGATPRPTLLMTSLKGILEESASNEYFTSLKRAILELDNMIGAKVTRIRTFYKFLDAANTNLEGVGQFTSGTGNNPEFPKEVYYVERKTGEDINGIQFELSSALEMENHKLPGRLCLATRCTWNYRGEGCCYEFKAKGNTELHSSTDQLPDFAPPIANEADELISAEISAYDPTAVTSATPTLYSSTSAYSTADIVYITKDNVNYYYVAKQAVPANNPPPHSDYWVADRCSKSLKGCRLRWGAVGAGKKCTDSEDPCTKGVARTLLPFGGFPGTNTKMTTE